jgi:hypothetical protein
LKYADLNTKALLMLHQKSLCARVLLENQVFSGMRPVAGFESHSSPLHYDFFGFIPFRLKNEDAALVLGANADKRIIHIYSFKLGAIVKGIEFKFQEKRKQCAMAIIDHSDHTYIVFSGGVGN